ncbi:MAG: delta-lactam-biosynthetic de-N-acetylase [Peptococcaceae bacterium]|nr:MAG: delta-lactam-biosynthetic de-N-acetylase [Peptococcaceae bacterium]
MRKFIWLPVAVAVLLLGFAAYSKSRQPAPGHPPAGKTNFAGPITGLKENPSPENRGKPDGDASGNGSQAPAVSEPDSLALDNTRRGWGLKRNDSHEQPEVPAAIRSLLSKYDAYYIGAPDSKVVYLTFDEGYENGYTAEILDILKNNDVKAAFFITGHYLETNPELVKRMMDEGHIVGNHTMSHPSLPDLTAARIAADIRALEQAYEKLAGQKMRYLRPPKGEYSERSLAETRAMGYYNIFWSLAFVDWVPVPGGAAESYRSVMDNLHNGAVILLHAVSKENTEALDKILKDVKTQGYEFKTLDDLVKK